MENFKYHPIAECLPLIDGEEFEKFCADIQANGLLEPIVLHEGMILDGRNRMRACLASGVEIRTRVYSGSDPIGFVASQNLHRRHLSVGQRCDYVDAVSRLQKGGSRSILEKKDLNADISTRNQTETAKMAGVSRHSVQQHLKLKDSGREDLVKKVHAGEMPLNTAVRIAVPKKPVGRPRKESNPWQGWQDQIDTFCRCLDDDTFLEIGENEVTPTQRAEMIKSLLRLVSVTNKQIVRLKKSANRVGNVDIQ